MNLNTFVYCFLGILSFYFTSINVQTDNIPFHRKIYVFMYIFLISTAFAPYLGQCTTILALLGVIILLSWKLSYKVCNIISLLLGFLISVCLNYLISAIIFCILNLSIQDIKQHYLLPFGIINLLILFYLTKLLGWLLHKKIRIQELRFPKELLFCILASLIVSVIIFLFGIIWGAKIDYPTSAIVLNGFLFSIYFVLTIFFFIFLYRTIRKNDLLKLKIIQYENLETYTHEIEQLYMDMRSFKHDYVDIITSLKYYIDTNDMDALNNYFNNHILTLNQSFQSTDYKLGLLSNLRISELKFLIASKLLYAIEKGISTDIEIVEPIDTIFIDIIDLIRVISIFLNNAIEAALISHKKKIQLAIISTTDSITIILSNSSPLISVPVSQLCNYGFSTKGAHRGIGMNNAKKILDLYPNIIWDMIYNDFTFTQQLTILNET